MIPFERLDPAHKGEYDPLLRRSSHRGCTFSFANLYIWGRQSVARVGEDLLIFSHYAGRTMYPYPVCAGDPRPALNALMADARERGIPFRLSGLNREDVEHLQSWYPDQFVFHCGRGGHDYVYAIDDLADLKGKKYQPKRNHINRFLAAYPNVRILPLSEETLPAARALADRWHARRDPEEEQLKLDPIRFRYSTESVVEEKVEAPAPVKDEEKPRRTRRPNKPNKPQQEQPRKEQPKKAPEPKKEAPQPKAEPVDKPDQPKKPYRRRPPFRHKKPKPTGDNNA